MEKTPENLYAVLEKYILMCGQDEIQQFLNDFKIFGDTNVIHKVEKIFFYLLDNFYPNYRLNENFNFEYQNYMSDARNYSHSRCLKSHMRNVTELSFKSLYPNIIVKLSEYNAEKSDKHKDIDPYGEENWGDVENKIRWSIIEFPSLFKFILESRDYIKSRENKLIDNITRGILNYAYGMTMSARYNKIKANGMELVTAKGREIDDFFINKYPNNLVFVNVDVLYFINYDEIKDSVEKDLKELDYPYSYENYLHFILIEDRKYVASNDPDLKVCGLRKIDKLDGRRVIYKKYD